MGGEGRIDEVLDPVETLMHDRLTAVDRQQLPAGTRVRWSNTARWMGARLARECRLRPDSPWDVRQLAEAGYDILSFSEGREGKDAVASTPPAAH